MESAIAAETDEDKVQQQCELFYKDTISKHLFAQLI